MVSVVDDGGIKDRMMHAVEARIFRQYGLKELAKMAENQHRHHYTCLAAPPELVALGLTHMVCRVDTVDQPVAAFNSSQAALMQCNSLNGFAKQDDPSLRGPDEARQELDEANRLAEEREKEAELAEKVKAASLEAQKPGTFDALTVAQKLAAAQVASVNK